MQDGQGFGAVSRQGLINCCSGYRCCSGTGARPKASPGHPLYPAAREQGIVFLHCYLMEDSLFTNQTNYYPALVANNKVYNCQYAKAGVTKDFD